MTKNDWVVVLMCSRNKDNKGVPNFKQRFCSWFGLYDIDKIRAEFIKFGEQGLPGEVSRLYISVNARDPEKVKTKLVHYLIDEDPKCLTKMDNVIASIAERAECALTKKWLFDVDVADESKFKEFICDLQREIVDDEKEPEPVEIVYYKTISGYHVITPHGFDTRELLDKWGQDVSLHRDGMSLEQYFTN